MNWKLLKKISKNNYDLVFLTKADTINYHLLPIFNFYSKTWFYFMDPIETAFEWDIYKLAKNSTWSSSTFSNVNKLFNLMGANSFHITQGLNMEVFYPNNHIKKEIDLVFVGTKTAKRNRNIESLRNKGISVVCFGQGWEHKPIYISNLVEIYQKSKIVLNFTRGSIGFSIRVFQVMGTGSFLLTEYCKDIQKYFEAGTHLDWFKNEEDLYEKAKYYLVKEENREKIAKAGLEYVKREFSWKKIMKTIMELVLVKK